MQHAQHIEIIALLQAGSDDGFDRRASGIDDGRGRIGDDEGAERRAADDDELPGLPDVCEMAREMLTRPLWSALHLESLRMIGKSRIKFCGSRCGGRLVEPHPGRREVSLGQVL
jgi:hypothetical protein